MIVGNIEVFFAQYVATALWSSNDESTDDGGEPLDKNYDAGDLAPETAAAMRQDCEKFLAAHAAIIGDDEEQAGHDFWLNRNGHGAGFWDGDWPEPAATTLDKASKAFGEVDLYVGDDGRIYS